MCVVSCCDEAELVVEVHEGVVDGCGCEEDDLFLFACG